MLLQIKCPANLARAGATHAQSNTEPDPRTDLRMQLRDLLVRDVLPAVK